MRIVAGKYRNRRIDPPQGIEARPTTDFAKEGLFNVLQHSVPLEGIRVLDLFAGTGNMSLEFLSRGAVDVVSVEQDRKLFAFIQRTIAEIGETGWRVVKEDVFKFLSGHRSKYDIIFADPPFHMEGTERIASMVFENALLAPDGVLIIEHHEKTDLSAVDGYIRNRKYGQIVFSIFGGSNEEMN
ncbi:MAG: 16S rRNA (guanine(966)-N(2))-methyltransferase RsmD [Flavobacteriales bacterium]|nr:16S rRNA (guanine(966)-N(2))-methyltransferase RsmD [Flavobacteriales bacterium]MBP7155473.1 16S rRNA (guanine(966)-N(2))-methyltransferase RsmD [Flavobacteriales bacterium]HQV74992.1 16S rRNA (guanine(966)-N(2))-methyltransferase RsmD [Flavobacteriales bacterium]